MEDEGRESQWNEASLKAKRLDEVQQLINFYKVNPLGFTEGKFNYEWLLKYVDALYGEGRSKYSSAEKKEVDRIREIANSLLRFMPPHIKTYKDSMAGTTKAYLFNQKNYDKFMDLLYDFEMIVKDYNDKHGLTTQNRDEDDGL